MSGITKFQDVESRLRPTIMDVDLNALSQNYVALKEMAANAEVMPILKANAYGHGLVPCAKQLAKHSPWGFGVAFLEEAIVLRKAGIDLPILALGGVCGRQIDSFLDYNIDICASSVMKLEAIDAKAQSRSSRARVHLKVDTGMERIGVHYYNAEKLFQAALNCKNCDIVGVFSHFADAENKDLSFTKMQLDRFLEAISFFENSAIPKPRFHLANSPALLNFPESRLDIVRPGLSLFGVSPFEHEVSNTSKLRPTMTLKSEVVFFKVIPESTHVSYGLTWKSQAQTRIATIAVGYGDGYPRTLSNRGRILIRGKSYPIVGRVCMDQFMVDLGPDGEAYNDDEVILIGGQGEEAVTVEEISKLSGIDPRDIMLRIASRVPRRYHCDGDIYIQDACA